VPKSCLFQTTMRIKSLALFSALHRKSESVCLSLIVYTIFTIESNQINQLHFFTGTIPLASLTFWSTVFCVDLENILSKNHLLNYSKEACTLSSMHSHILIGHATRLPPQIQRIFIIW
jgi:hypothetical protein